LTCLNNFAILISLIYLTILIILLALVPILDALLALVVDAVFVAWSLFLPEPVINYIKGSISVSINRVDNISSQKKYEFK
jgi:Na+-transporting NADH:ubiquinone oxidoreductase subunit NqrE